MAASDSDGPGSPAGRHRLETPLAAFSLAALLVYVPGETWASWPHLASPGYVVDVLAMALLAYGGAHSLRRRPWPAAGPLCGAWGFCACLAWRTYFLRVYARERALPIDLDEPRWFADVLAVVLAIALPVFALALWLASRPARTGPGDHSPGR